MAPWKLIHGVHFEPSKLGFWRRLSVLQAWLLGSASAAKKLSEAKVTMKSFRSRSMVDSCDMANSRSFHKAHRGTEEDIVIVTKASEQVRLKKKESYHSRQNISRMPGEISNIISLNSKLEISGSCIGSVRREDCDCRTNLRYCALADKGLNYGPCSTGGLHR